MRYQVQSGCLLSCWPFNKHYESHPSCQPRGFEDDVTVAVATQNGQFSFISGLHKTSLVPPTPPRAVAGIECPAVTKAGEGKPGVGWGGGRTGPGAGGKRPRNPVPTTCKNQTLLFNGLQPNSFSANLWAAF